MKIGGVYSSKIARARLISQARMKSAGRAKKFSGSRINTGLSSGSYMDQLRKGLTSKTGNTGAALSNLQKKSNYTSLISSAESLKKHADKLLDTKEEESLFTEEKKEQAVKEIKGFVEDYNRMVERLQRVGTTVSSLYLKQLQGHVADNKDLLRELGITQNTTGTLKINEDKHAGWLCSIQFDEKCDDCFFSCSCFMDPCPKARIIENGKESCPTAVHEIDSIVRFCVKSYEVLSL